MSTIPEPNITSRVCSHCEAPDRLETDEYGRPAHYVTIELRKLLAATEVEARESITPYMKLKGWRYKLFGGQHMRERFVCRACLRDLTEMERDWSRKARNSQQNNTAGYYEVLCT